MFLPLLRPPFHVQFAWVVTVPQTWMPGHWTWASPSEEPSPPRHLRKWALWCRCQKYSGNVTHKKMTLSQSPCSITDRTTHIFYFPWWIICLRNGHQRLSGQLPLNEDHVDESLPRDLLVLGISRALKSWVDSLVHIVLIKQIFNVKNNFAHWYSSL